MISVQLGEKETLYMKNYLHCHTGEKMASSVIMLYLYKKVVKGCYFLVFMSFLIKMRKNKRR